MSLSFTMILDQDSVLLDQELESILYKYGLCDYVIEEAKETNDKVYNEKEITNYLKQLFTSKATPLATKKSKLKMLKKEDKAQTIQPKPIQVSPKFLIKCKNLDLI